MMARSALLKRLDRLEQTAIGEQIVCEVGDLIPEEQRERFLQEVIGEVAPNSLVVWVRRFGVPDLPPRLLHRWPVSGGGKGSGRASGADPVRLQEVVPKYNPALSYRPRDVDTDVDDL